MTILLLTFITIKQPMTVTTEHHRSGLETEKMNVIIYKISVESRCSFKEICNARQSHLTHLQEWSALFLVLEF